MAPPVGMSPAQGAMVGLIGLQVVGSYFGGKSTALGYKMKAAAQRQQAKQARTDAKASALRLSERFNDVAANNAVMMAASGRSFSSGSYKNMQRVDEENMQWDLDYNNAAGEIGAQTIEADASGYDSAARQAKSGGIQKGLLSAVQGYVSYKRIT